MPGWELSEAPEWRSCHGVCRLSALAGAKGVLAWQCGRSVWQAPQPHVEQPSPCFSTPRRIKLYSNQFVQYDSLGLSVWVSLAASSNPN